MLSMFAWMVNVVNIQQKGCTIQRYYNTHSHFPSEYLNHLSHQIYNYISHLNQEVYVPV